MFVVIFKAEIASLDDEYFATAVRMRERAMSEYGCVDFVSLSEGERELSLSYWNSREDIRRWRDDPEHRQAQAMGRDRWYRRYQVEIAEIRP